MLINNLILLPTFAASTISPQDCCNSTPSPYPLYLSSAQWPEGSCWNVRQITSLLYYRHSSGFHPNAREKVTTFIKRCMTWNPAPPTHTLLSDCSSSSLSPSWLWFSQNPILAGQVCCLRAFAFAKPSAWVTLPPNINMAPFLASFRSTQMELHLLGLFYNPILKTNLSPLCIPCNCFVFLHDTSLCLMNFIFCLLGSPIRIWVPQGQGFFWSLEEHPIVGTPVFLNK